MYRVRTVTPLVVFLSVLAGAAYVGYQIYVSAEEIRLSAKERMNKKNVIFTRSGVKVGVKHMEEEKYVDKTQSWVVKAWNMGKSMEDESLRKR